MKAGGESGFTWSSRGALKLCSEGRESLCRAEQNSQVIWISHLTAAAGVWPWAGAAERPRGCLRRDGAGAGCRVLAPEFCSEIPTEPDGTSGARGSQYQELTKREVTPFLCDGNSSVNGLQALLGHRLHSSEAASFLRLPFTHEVRVRHSKAK